MSHERKQKVERLQELIKEANTYASAWYKEEQDLFDKMPRNLQSTSYGQDNEDAINTLGRVLKGLQNALVACQDLPQ